MKLVATQRATVSFLERTRLNLDNFMDFDHGSGGAHFGHSISVTTFLETTRTDLRGLPFTEIDSL